MRSVCRARSATRAENSQTAQQYLARSETLNAGVANDFGGEGWGSHYFSGGEAGVHLLEGFAEFVEAADSCARVYSSAKQFGQSSI